MPLYKFVGNRILTTLQNRLLGTQLSRVPLRLPGLLACRAARGSRFELNTNDFHFDTEIIIQLMRGRLRIVELPIPTYYGDEICRVNGHQVREGRAHDALSQRAAQELGRCSTTAQVRLRPSTASNVHYRPEARVSRARTRWRSTASPPGRACWISAAPAGTWRRCCASGAAT